MYCWSLLQLKAVFTAGGVGQSLAKSHTRVILVEGEVSSALVSSLASVCTSLASVHTLVTHHTIGLGVRGGLCLQLSGFCIVSCM